MSDEFQTPQFVLSGLLKGFGLTEFALDPCASKYSPVNARVKFFREEGVDGLVESWASVIACDPTPGPHLVFVNPPYSRGKIDKFAQKCMLEALLGVEMVILVNASTSSSWWQRLANASRNLCLPPGRIRFLENGVPSKHLARNPSCLFYFGENDESFHASMEYCFGALIPSESELFYSKNISGVDFYGKK